jgi:hypothetical protein
MCTLTISRLLIIKVKEFFICNYLHIAPPYRRASQFSRIFPYTSKEMVCLENPSQFYTPFIVIEELLILFMLSHDIIVPCG